MKSIIFHIDVNSAYLSWSAIEELKNGAEIDLREVPSIIGGSREDRHGIVLAKSIPAKKYGIQTGEPVVNAIRKCGNLLIVPPNHEIYSAYSRELMKLLYEYTPDIEQVSVDECYLDFTGIAHQYKSPESAANLIKNNIQKELGFTVNIGISTTKVLAKMASDFRKPNLVHTLYLEEIEKKMWPLKVQELFMAGKSSVQTLHNLGIRTIGELANTEKGVIEQHLKSQGRRLWEYANGIDDSKVDASETELKGVGNSVTLPKDITQREEARKVLLSLAEKVAGRLRKRAKKAQSISVEVKNAEFQKSSHQMQFIRPENTANEIYGAALRLFDESWKGEPIRLLGIRTTKLVDEKEPQQMSIFDMMDNQKIDEKHKKLDEAIDDIKKRFGDGAIVRGTFFEKEK